MPRGLSANMIAALGAGTVFPIFLVELHFNSETVYTWTGRGDVSWNGHTWKGVGPFGGVGDIVETEEIIINGTTLTLTGIPYVDPATGNAVDPIQQVEDECGHSNPVTIYFALFDNAGSALIGDPTTLFVGRMDKIETEDNASTCTITMHVEPLRIDINRDKTRRFTDQDQRLTYPTDSGFKQVVHLLAWSGLSSTGTAKIPTLPNKLRSLLD